MSGLSTHVLDTSRGLPAAGLGVSLERQADTGAWGALASGATDSDGRVKSLLPAGTALSAGVYRLRFETGAYLAKHGSGAPFYPHVDVVFQISDPTRHHHVPLLLSPFGYTTYRGS